MELVPALVSLALGYLLGSIPFGLVIVQAAGLGDIRTIGSGNIGATNVLRTGRKDLALATFLLDSGKAGIALAIARHFFGEEAGFLAGGAAFLGHCFPVWLKFKGGKGVATFFGVLLTGLPFVGVAAAASWLLTAFVFRYSSLGALVAAVLAPAFAWWLNGAPFAVGFCVVLAVLIFWRHKENIQRLLAGTESKIGQKKQAS
jgi:acyl phosphate:glycerol-3-phosphate acyltransferase